MNTIPKKHSGKDKNCFCKVPKIIILIHHPFLEVCYNHCSHIPAHHRSTRSAIVLYDISSIVT